VISPAPSRRPPILLGNASWTGTLAAVRLLGRHGIPVIVTDDRLLPNSRFSRHAARYVRSPSYDRDRFIEWLLDFGRREPGMVLYPTSDSLTYLYTRHAGELGKVFRLSLPTFDSVLAVLDKKRLYAAACAAGLSTPATWFPQTREDLEKLASSTQGGLVVKPRTQALSSIGSKGAIVTDMTELVQAYDRVLTSAHFGRELLAEIPDAARPMVQVYYPDAAEEIYLLAGFVDESRDLFAIRASLKVFQWPRRLGVGLCFEDAKVDHELSAGVRRLLRETGYRGLFQIEFIRSGGRHLLIDFNPRFYHPLAFEIARGLPLPLMVYAAACGDEPWLRKLVEESARPHEGPQAAFCNGFGLHMLLAAQRLSGRMSPELVQKWRDWYVDRDGRRVDSHADQSDPLPSIAFAADEVYRAIRHPRFFVRSIVLNR
jgi:D-aspartate ligase